MPKTPGTVPQSVQPNKPEAPVVVAPRPSYQPRRLERQGVSSSPTSERYPQIRGGTCEYCGSLDPNTPAEMQYRLCPHFRDLGEIRCSYCDESQDPKEVMLKAKMNVAVDPDNNLNVIAWCNSTKCADKHIARFQRSK